MMRISGYLIAGPITDQPFFVLMHGYTGAVDKVAASVGEILLRDRGKAWSESELTGLLTAAEQNHLLERGYLTELSAAEERDLVINVATALHEDTQRTIPTSFVFVPTYLCNLRCPYCFQSHQMHRGVGPFSAIIDERRIDHAFAVIDRLAGPGGVARALAGDGARPAAPQSAGCDIGLFGGEPLCEQTLPAVRYIVDRTTERGGRLWAITNGVQLNLFSDLLGPDLIRDLQITLDGSAQLHNKRRIGPGLHSTFDMITDNIDLALSRGVTVAVRINTDASNLSELGKLDGLFEERGWSRSPHFSANAAVVTPGGANEEFLDRRTLTEATIEGRSAGSIITSYELYAEETLANCLVNDGYPFRRIVNCSAETGLLMFDPLGDVYSCWDDVGHDEHKVGTYDEEGLHLITEAAAPWIRRFPGAIEQCSLCPYALVHASGCAKRARDRCGTLFAPDCDSFQTYFPRTLGDAYARAEKAILGGLSVSGIAPGA